MKKKNIWIGAVVGCVLIAGLGAMSLGENENRKSVTLETKTTEQNDPINKAQKEEGKTDTEKRTAEKTDAEKTDTKKEEDSTKKKDSEYLGISGKSSVGDIYRAAVDYQEFYQVLANRKNDVVYDECYTEEAVADGAAADDAAADYAAEDRNEGAMSVNTATAQTSYSKTNLMTEGVDESDLVKTDGNYIYCINDSEVKIMDIRKGKPKKTAEVRPKLEEPTSEIQEIYVDGDRLIIIMTQVAAGHLPDYSYEDEIYYENRWESGRQETLVDVYDISDRENPVELGKMRQDGSYRTSRKVGSKVYLFTDYGLVEPKFDVNEASKKENLSTWIPTANGIPVAPECIYLSENPWDALVLTSFDIEQPQEILDAKVVAYSDVEIYVGTEAIYLYGYQYQDSFGVAKLKYQDGRILPGESAALKGWINDDFAINEYKGQLRVLTTRWEEERVNTLYILDENLRMEGRLDDIAEGETIYSARFMGDTAYFVTYRNRDPLFTADLSDPENPKLIGVLSVTGFSDYLHFWGEDRLLGIGYETDPETGEMLGVKLSMFNIENPRKVYEENKLVLEKLGHSDSISGNYKAILADPTKNLIGFSANLSDYDAWDEINYEVFTYDKEEGFQVKLEEEMLNSRSTGNIRGLYSGDYFYIVKGIRIMTYNMKDWEWE